MSNFSCFTNDSKPVAGIRITDNGFLCAVVDLNVDNDRVVIHFNDEKSFFAFCEKHNIPVEDERGVNAK